MNFDDGGIEPPYIGYIVHVRDCLKESSSSRVIESNLVPTLHIQYFQKLSLLL